MKSWIVCWIRLGSPRAESNINHDVILTSETIRQRLAGTELPASPTDIVMPPGSSRWPEPMREQLSGTLKPAGVLIPVIERGAELSVLLTQRSAELKHHAGQVSFPGGRMEEHDVSVEATALRETREEVGIDAQHISVLGYLQTMPTITGYAVTPVVGMVSADAKLVIDPTEVEYTFEVPLSFLLDESNDVRTEWDTHDRTVPMVEFHWKGERIWGATAFMIISFRKKMLNQ
jgi:8-oxo-dGTP pyrophosphatase MutT (NUDIX family)